MNKKHIIIIVLSVCLLIVLAFGYFLMFGNPFNNSDTTATSPVIEMIEPSNPEEMLEESFIAAKEALGDEYYPSVTISDTEIAEMFGLKPEDYVFAIGQKSASEDRIDMLISIKTKNAEEGDRISDILTNYARKMSENSNQYPPHIAAAIDGILITRDLWGYVFFIATFGDIDKLDANDPQKITEYAEANNLKVTNAILNRIHE